MRVRSTVGGARHSVTALPSPSPVFPSGFTLSVSCIVPTCQFESYTHTDPPPLCRAIEPSCRPRPVIRRIPVRQGPCMAANRNGPCAARLCVRGHGPGLPLCDPEFADRDRLARPLALQLTPAPRSPGSSCARRRRANLPRATRCVCPSPSRSRPRTSIADASAAAVLFGVARLTPWNCSESRPYTKEQ